MVVLAFGRTSNLYTWISRLWMPDKFWQRLKTTSKSDMSLLARPWIIDLITPASTEWAITLYNYTKLWEENNQNIMKMKCKAPWFHRDHRLHYSIAVHQNCIHWVIYADKGYEALQMNLWPYHCDNNPRSQRYEGQLAYICADIQRQIAMRHWC